MIIEVELDTVRKYIKMMHGDNPAGYYKLNDYLNGIEQEHLDALPTPQGCLVGSAYADPDKFKPVYERDSYFYLCEDDTLIMDGAKYIRADGMLLLDVDATKRHFSKVTGDVAQQIINERGL